MASSEGRERRWTIYVCPECDHIEGEEFWDATDRHEKGLPACPVRGYHGQIDMEVFEVVPVSALEAVEAEKDEMRAALRVAAVAARHRIDVELEN